MTIDNDRAIKIMEFRCAETLATSKRFLEQWKATSDEKFLALAKEAANANDDYEYLKLILRDDF